MRELFEIMAETATAMRAAPAGSKSIFEGGSPIPGGLLLFLIQIVLVIVLCKLLAYFFKYIKQPPVIAEVVAGIILGKSALGKIPGYTDKLWNADSLVIFNVFANWGLIIFMFIVGLELDTKIMKRNAHHAIAISITAMICPFALGIASSWVIHDRVGNEDTSFSSFLLFVAVAMSITAFPVLARILTETKMLHTRVGTLALSAAAVDDVTAWCLLALVVAYAKAGKQINTLWTFLCLIGFVIFMVFVIRPFLASIAKRRHQSAKIKYNLLVCLMVGMFLCSWYTEVIGVHAIFGSFVLGIVVPRRNNFAGSIIERLEDLVVIVLLPLYFTFSGIRTDIGSLSHALDWGLVVLIVVTACVGKIMGGVLAARFIGCNWRDSFTVGILMNTKGLVELIVLNVGLDAGVLNTKIFTMFVIMALVTTFLTTPILHFVYLRHLQKSEEEELQRDDTYSIAIASQNTKTFPDLITVSSVFASVKEKLNVKALFLTEISDRPSSYLFSEFYHTFQGAPFLGGKERSGLLSEMNTKARESGVAVLETKSIASADIPEEVADWAATHHSNMIMFDMHHSVHQSTVKRAATHLDMRHSVSTNLDSQVQRVFSFGNAEGLLTVAIKKIQCPISVLIQKTSNGIDKVDQVLFLYTGDVCEQTALDLADALPKTVKLTVISRGELKLKREATLIICTNPLSSQEFKDESNKGYDLVIMGAGRDSSWDGYLSDPVHASKLPVLLVFPPKFAALDDVSVQLDDRSSKSGSGDSASVASIPHSSSKKEEGIDLPETPSTKSSLRSSTSEDAN